MDTSADLQARLVDLEMRLSFQESALLELSDALADSRAEAARNALTLSNVLAEMRSLRGLLYADPSSEPPPPHY